MPTAPYAKLFASINGGALQDDGITAAIGDTVDLSAESTVAWALTGSTAPRWDIFGFPPSFTVPAGWSTDATTGGFYYLGVTPPQFTLSVWGKYMLRLLVNGGGGTKTDESTAITVPHASGIVDLGDRETTQFGNSWGDDHRANLRVIASGLGTAAAPADATYLIGAANGALTSAVVWTSIGTTVAFASTSTIPCSFSRTDSATAASVDTATFSTLSSGTAANGFGVGCLFKAEGAGGTAIDYGRVAFTVTDITASSEDTKAVIQTRTAGAALATAAEFSGTSAKLPGIATGVAGLVAISTDGTLSRTASAGGADATAPYFIDSATAVNAGDIPMRAIATKLAVSGAANVTPIALSFKAATGSAASGPALELRRSLTSGVGSNGTFVSEKWILPDYDTGADIAAGSKRIEATAGLGTTIKTKLVIALPDGSTPADVFTISSTGAVRMHLYAAGRALFDSSGNITSSAVSFTEVNTALAAASAPIDFGGEDLTNLGAITANGDVVVSGNLTVSGTTTTVDSTSVSLADRLVVFNSSTGIVVAPVNISGFIVDRGSADGVTKRDMAGVFWDETNSRFDFAYNTTGDQSTIGAFLAVKLGALTVSGLGAGIVHSSASGVFSSSAVVNADVDAAAAIAGTKIAPDFGSQNITTTGTLATGVAAITLDAIGTTKTRALEIGNATVSGSQVSGQLGMHAFHSGGVRQNIGFQVEAPGASNVTQTWFYGTGTGVPSSQLFQLNNSDANFGSMAQADAFVIRSGIFVGFRFNDSNNRGGLALDNGDYAIVLKSYNTKNLRIETGADSGGSGGVVRCFWSGTGTGRAVFVPTAPTSAANALTINLATSQNAEHAITENTTVTISGATPGMRGTIVFKQDGTGRTVTMPTNGSGVEYDAAILALTTTGIVDAVAGHRTVLNYYVLADVANRVYFYSRSTSVIP